MQYVKLLPNGADMPQYGLLTDPIYKTTDEISRFAKLGFDYAEINIEEPYGTPQRLIAEKRKILSLLKKNNMFAVGHTAYWVDFGTEHKKVLAGWIGEAKEMISAAAELDMELLNFHFFGGNSRAGKIPGTRKVFLDNFSRSMKILSAFGRTKGVTLMLENLGPRNESSYRIKDFSYVMKKVPSLMVHLDVAHAYIEGGNKMIDEYIRRFSKKIVHIHAHDNSGKRDEHLPIGDGTINFKRVVSSLKRIGYDKTITFEVFTSNSDAQKSREKFKRLWARA